MEISSLIGTGAVQYIDWSQIDSEEDSSKMKPPVPGGPFGECPDISEAGKLHSALSEMTEEEKAEMQAFHEQMRQAVESGEFDASEMAEEAPDALKTFAEENGIDLEEMLTDMATKGGGRMGGPPPPVGLYNSDGIGLSDYYEDPEDLRMDLVSQLFADEDSDESTQYF